MVIVSSAHDGPDIPAGRPGGVIVAPCVRHRSGDALSGMPPARVVRTWVGTPRAASRGRRRRPGRDDRIL
ncbi:hypothetical protein LI90_1653 [Carbonactinospora thermoautotrophica]|uniref:Uncharacterized protein n=1 Tax=Carbonactinospora thermoautotrophica TaxID=1469144 RepID=A0A132MS20_9ACTN|nr:hypothetical protein LI90_1653 [Carbonactinospora thermoautotrophica]